MAQAWSGGDDASGRGALLRALRRDEERISGGARLRDGGAARRHHSRTWIAPTLLGLVLLLAWALLTELGIIGAYALPTPGAVVPG